MKKIETKSCFSTKLDPYRAGLEIGENLAEINPELIFLFPTIHYNGSAELTEAIYDAIGNDKTILIGCTGDGFYEKGIVADIGVSAIGYNFSGNIKLHIEYETGVGKEPYNTTRNCLSKFEGKFTNKEPLLYFFVTDFRTDNSIIIKAIQEVVTVPVIGGSAGDNLKMERSFVYSNRKVFEDSIVILGIEGILNFDILIGHDMQPIGISGIVTATDGTNIHSIDGIPAMDFIERELGKPIELVDIGSLAIKIIVNKDLTEHRILSLLLPEANTNQKDIRLFGGIEVENEIQLCLASPERIIQEVKDIGRALNNLPFTPNSAIIISCAGRKHVLGSLVEEEVKEIVEGCGSMKALAGFPSFGEFAPIKGFDGYSHPLYHNMTFILLIIGDEN